MKSRLRSERNRPSSLVEPLHKGVVQCMPLKSYDLEILFAKQALIYKVAIPVYQSKIDSSLFFTSRSQFSTSHTCELPNHAYLYTSIRVSALCQATFERICAKPQLHCCTKRLGCDDRRRHWGLRLDGMDPIA